MYCKSCGKEISNNAAVCPNCGASQGIVVKDEGGFGWGLLGFLIPIVGLILYLIWKDTKPNTAKSAGKGALIAAIVYVLYALVIGWTIGSMV